MKLPSSTARIRRIGIIAALVAAGYALGAGGTLRPNAIEAQAPPQGISEETTNRIREIHRQLTTAAEALQSEGAYTAATEGTNAFLVLSGGGDAIADLESGRGVDPETFAGLYAGMALPEVADHLGRDEQGRVTYKDEVVRLYSINRIEQMMAERLRLATPEL